LSDLDNINLFNGNLSFRIPLLTIGGRGSAGYTMTLRPNENRFNWRVIHNIQQTCGQFGCTVTGHTYYPTINWWATTANQPGYTLGVLVGRKAGEDPGTPAGCPNGTNVFRSTLTRITFSSGDGTEYELRDQLRSGQPQPLPGGTCGGQASLRGKVFVTGDGTSATFISDSDIYDSAWVNSETFYPSGYLLLSDGTRYRIDSGSVSWIRDRNGNKITFSPNGTITDTLKRTVTYSSGAPDVITLKGFGGATRTIQISRLSLSTALRPCRTDPGYQCFSIQTYKQLFPNSDGSSVTQFNPDVVSAITLPDGRQYRFYYNSYAELARVDLPTGGVIEYDYDDVFGAPNGNARLNTPPAELAGELTFALPTQITNALGQSVYAQFDYYLARPVDAEDLNGVVSSGYFNDPLDRPTQIRRAVGTPLENQSTFAYDDTNRLITTSRDRDANNDNILKTQLLYDMMGRTIETRQFEGGTNYIATQTQYDALGRSYKTSNSYRPLQSESAVWTMQTLMHSVVSSR
jgi:YD repeat-containing protein